MGVDWGSGLPFMEPCDENGQSTVARQMTTRPDFCPVSGNNGLGLEMDIFGQQGPNSTTFGIEVWNGAGYVLLATKRALEHRHV